MMQLKGRSADGNRQPLAKERASAGKVGLGGLPHSQQVGEQVGQGEVVLAAAAAAPQAAGTGGLTFDGTKQLVEFLLQSADGRRRRPARPARSADRQLAARAVTTALQADNCNIDLRRQENDAMQVASMRKTAPGQTGALVK